VFQGLKADALSEYTRLFTTYGDSVRIEMGPFLTHFLFHPDQVKHVLVTACDKYNKDTYGNRRLKSFTGRGLLFSEGSVWQRQRRLTQPLLASREHEYFGRFTREALLTQMDSWPNGVTHAGASDVQELVARAMFAGIMRALVSREPSAAETMKVRWALGTLMEESIGTAVPKIRGEGGAQEAMDDFSRASTSMDNMMLDYIRERRGKPPQADFLGCLMAHSAAEQSPFTEDELLAQLKTMLLAGHDTAAHTVAFALYFLSTRPQWQARIRQEASWLSEPPLTVSVARMRDTEAVLMETMRLLPAIWAMERRALEDDEVMGCRIPKGSSIVLSPYITHRHPQFWQQPNEFKPERFLEANVNRHKYAYLPFGGGPRICVGNNVGLLNLKVALATILSRFQVELSPDFKYEFKHLVVLRFRHGLPMKLVPVE